MSFTKGGPYDPRVFGENAFLRSTVGYKTESGRVAAGAVNLEDTGDGTGATQKILQKGEVMANITDGEYAGMLGPFQAGATDGRQTLANIVGLNNSFLPWQLLEHDENIAVVYIATAHQGWCTTRDASGKRVPMSDEVADAMRSLKGLDVTFK